MYRWILVALAIAAAVHAGLEVSRAPAERAAEIQRWERDLAALADERRLSVVDWLKSAAVDVQSVAAARKTSEILKAAASGEAAPADAEDVLDRWARPRGEDLAGLWIVGAGGSVLASVSHATPPDQACLEAAGSAEALGRPGRFHLHGGEQVVALAAAIAIPGAAATATRPTASSAAALLAFAAKPLFARLARRPSQPNTLESYLVGSHDGRLEYLSPLLLGTPVGGAFEDPRLGARAAAEGRDTFVEGLDYRDSVDHSVLTVTRAKALAPLGERQRSRRLVALGVWIGLFGMAFGAARAQRAALALEASRVAARYLALVDHANDALVILDADGRIVEANRRASELYGRTRDEILRMNARDFRPRKERGETDERMAQVLKAGGGVFDATHARADGTTFPVEVSARLVTGTDGERRVVVVARDVTARRADADRIHRLNRMLRTLSSVNELLIRAPEEQHLFDEVCRISVEKAGFVAAWIGLADRATGRVNIAAAAGAHEFLRDLDLRWDVGALAEGPTGTAIREGRTIALGDFGDDGPEGAWRDIGRQQGFGACAATPIRRGGAIIGSLSLYAAEPGAFDPEIVGLIEEMAADMGFALTTIDNRRRERALLVAKEAAEQASGAKSTFLAHISHEIRTPMNAVLGYAQLLQRDPVLGDAQRRKVEIILSSGAHLLQILNDVLEMSKIEAGRVSLTTAPFDLRAMLGEVESMFKVLTGAKGVELALECESRLPGALDGDVGKVKQVVINLLSNAVKFTEEGRIGIRASSDAVDARRHAITIAVEDSGIGIDAEGLTRLFQKFEQLDAGARIGGTGLGLAISRNFAQLMGGDLTVTSRPGAGSVFTFTFEAKVAAVVPGDREPRRLPLRLDARRPPPKILVVDDVPTNRALCDELLTRVGFECREASSGEEALTAHEAWRPDLVLMDLRMPGMGGFEAMKQLRAGGSTARIVALTASSLTGSEGDAFAAGADMFVRKPYDEADLLHRIGELLGLEYRYAEDSLQAPRSRAGGQPLSQLVSGLPADLVTELRAAATGAHARRIEELATRVSAHSEGAAAAIREAVGRFRYDLILDALETPGKSPV